jgi:cobalt/nickel transport system ATP-binding protein
MMGEILFDIKNVAYDYPTGECGLAGVSVEVKKGDRMAVLGANASGKSTLLRLLAGLCFASDGAVTAYGKPLTQDTLDGREFRKFFRSEIGMLFQNVDAQLFSATVEEDIAFGPLQLGLPLDEVRTRITDMAHLCGVDGLLSRSPHALSGGEKKRVALASVLAVNPSVLLLDEPTAGLDPRTEVWLLDMLDSLSSAGKTVVIATHDLRFASEFADRLIVLSEEHTVAAEGPPEKILSDEELLLRVNLIHSHAHRHGRTRHAHPHLHSLGHEHDHIA